MTHEVVLFDQQEHVALVTINRPEVRNAMNPEVLVRLAEIWQRVHDDDSIRAAILTGAGQVFCSGMDLGSMIPLITGARPPSDEWDKEIISDTSTSFRATLRNFDTVKPVISAINGSAIAGGMELVMACDIRVASDTARFGLQEAKWGLFPGGGSTVRLPNQIPYARAMEVLLTGDLFDASDMLEFGFLNYVVPTDEVLGKAFEIAGKIASNGPLAVKAIRQSVREAIGVPEPQALQIETGLSAPVFATRDAVEGPRAFMENRKPEFQGR